MLPSELNEHIESAYKRINNYGYLMREYHGLELQLAKCKSIEACELHNLANCSVCSGFAQLKNQWNKLNKRLRAQETAEFAYELKGKQEYFRGLQAWLKRIDEDIAYVVDRLQSGELPKDRIAEIKQFEFRLGECRKALALTLLPVWERQIKTRIHTLISQSLNSELKDSLKYLAKFNGKEFWAVYSQHKDEFNQVFNLYQRRSDIDLTPIVVQDVKFIPRQEEFNYNEDGSKFVESHTVRSEVATYDRKGGYRIVQSPIIVEKKEIAANKSEYVSRETVGERTSVMPTTRKPRRMSDSEYASYVQHKAGIEHPIVNPSATFIEKPFRLNKPSAINKLKELAQSDDGE